MGGFGFGVCFGSLIPSTTGPLISITTASEVKNVFATDAARSIQHLTTFAG